MRPQKGTGEKTARGTDHLTCNAFYISEDWTVTQHPGPLSTSSGKSSWQRVHVHPFEKDTVFPVNIKRMPRREYYLEMLKMHGGRERN